VAEITHPNRIINVAIADMLASPLESDVACCKCRVLYCDALPKCTLMFAATHCRDDYIGLECPRRRPAARKGRTDPTEATNVYGEMLGRMLSVRRRRTQ
jgi:hypothetical protein